MAAQRDAICLKCVGGVRRQKVLERGGGAA